MTIGLELSHIEKAQLDDVKRFFFKHYTPVNAILVVAGNVYLDQVRQLAEKWFGGIAPGEKYNRNLPDEPPQQEARRQVVKAKVPLDALMADTGESDGFDRAVLQRHAQALRSHIDTLAGRNYADLLPDTPELVVLYLPAESLLSLALAADAGLLDHAFGKGIALATPTTMLALLRTVNHGWRQEAVAQNAREIHALGAELHKRLATMSGHFRKIGAALDSAVKAYNSTVGSYETRVLPQARKFSELDLVSDAMAPVPAIENSPRALTVAELDLRDDEPLRAVGE
jgi:DNA anti-recombination protein RmuC